MRYFLLFLSFMTLLTQAKGQNADTLSYPEVGKPMPDLLIRNISYFPKKKAYIREFRGKWLLLDFWDINCSACIRSFPRINRIQQTFEGKLQVLMVGVQDAENKIQPLFAKFRKGENLIFPCAFDSALTQRLDLYYMPHTIVIDDRGIVRSIVVAIDTPQIREFLQGGNPQLPQTYRRMNDPNAAPVTVVDRHIAFNESKPFLVNGNGGGDSTFLYRSLLSNWIPGVHVYSAPARFEDAVKTGQFQVIGSTLDRLYNYAYFGASVWGYGDTLLYGKCFSRPVLEVKDSSLFSYSKAYCYSLIRPAEGNTKKIMQESMQRDLLNFFGLHASVELRKCPYWKIIAQPGALKKLKSKGGELFAHEISMKVGWTMRNCPISYLVDCISGYNPGRDPKTTIYLDETDITENIDITLDCIMFELSDVRRALQPYGLDILKGEKDMEVVVIRDN